MSNSFHVFLLIATTLSQFYSQTQPENITCGHNDQGIFDNQLPEWATSLNCKAQNIDFTLLAENNQDSFVLVQTFEKETSSPNNCPFDIPILIYGQIFSTTTPRRVSFDMANMTWTQSHQPNTDQFIVPFFLRHSTVHTLKLTNHRQSSQVSIISWSNRVLLTHVQILSGSIHRIILTPYEHSIISSSPLQQTLTKLHPILTIFNSNNDTFFNETHGYSSIQIIELGDVLRYDRLPFFFFSYF